LPSLQYAWWSKKSLGSWFADVLRRIKQLNEWSSDLELPMATWLPGLFNPMAFNTAIMQVTARKSNLPLDNMTIETHFTTMSKPEEVQKHPEDGALVYGMYIEGARWAGASNSEDAADERGDSVYQEGGIECGGFVVESRLKELLPAMPVTYIKAVVVQDDWEPSSVGYLRHSEDVYECPVYLTTFRGPTYVFLATLKTVDPISKWVLSGVALVMQEDD